MAYKVAVASTDWSSASTWRTNFNAPTMHASANLSLLTSGVFTEDAVAVNSTDKIEGVVIAPVAGFAARTITFTLQENGVDVGTPVVIAGNNIRLNQPLRIALAAGFTVTNGRTYRFKIQCDAGAPTIALSTTATRGAAIIYKDTTGAPAANDFVTIGVANATTGIVVTVDDTTAIYGDGSAPTSVFATGVLIRSWLCLAVCSGASAQAELAFKTNANTKLTWSSNLLVYPGSKLTQKPQAAYVSELYMNAASAISCFVGIYDGAYLDVQYGGRSNVAYWKTTIVSGAGTAASPLVLTDPVDWAVGDYVAISPGTNSATNYNETEYRYIITKNSTTSYVLSNTKGGSENALIYTHVGAYVMNGTRNVKWTALTANSWHINTTDTLTAGLNVVFKGVELSGLTTSGSSARAALCPNGASTIEDIVSLDNSTAGAVVGFISNTNALCPTFKRWLIGNGGASGSSQDGRVLLNGNSKVFDDCVMIDASKAGWKINGDANRWINCIGIAGGKSGALPDLYASWNVTGNNNVFDGCEAHAERGGGVLLYGAQGDNVFNNFVSGTKAKNAKAVLKAVNVVAYTRVIFNNLTYAETILFDQYKTGMLEGSYVGFHILNGNSKAHAGYTNRGSHASTGAGLAITTVRTAGSLNIALLPEDATNGYVYEQSIQALPNTTPFLSGYLYRNAAFSSGDITVAIYLPGTLLSGTPDASYTFPTTTLAWLPFNINKIYGGTVPFNATIRFTAKSAAAGAQAIIADYYDAVTPLNLWEGGRPLKQVSVNDFSSIPGLTWGYTDKNTVDGTMGRRQIDAADSAELAFVK